MTTAPEKHISRRSLLKRSAAAGAVVWAVPIIDTVLARPADASAVPCLTFNGSWLYVVFTFGGNTYFTGYSTADFGTTHCTPSSNPSSHGTATVTCGTIEYMIHNFTGTPADGDITFGPPGTPTANNATFVASPDCNTYLTLTGGAVSPKAGVVIVASFCFGAGKLSGACPVSGTSCANCG